MSTVSRIPPYPPTPTRKSLSPSKSAELYQTISLALAHALGLPPTKHDTPSAITFVASYAKDSCLRVLQSLIWETGHNTSKVEKNIHSQVLLLASKLARSSPSLETRTLIDLAVVYGPSHSSKVREVYESALASSPSLPSTFSLEVVPAFETLLSPAHSSGLYGLRKTAYCLKSLLNVCPPELVRPFSQSKAFILALARTYGDGLAAVAQSYGGLRVLLNAEARAELDEWERIWVETKVDLMDSFHLLLSTILRDMSISSGTSLVTESDRAFDTIFTLLERSQSEPVAATQDVPNTPFLNRSILADYQNTYNLSQVLASAVNHASEKDPRIDIIESSLHSFESSRSESRNSQKEPGVLKLLLRSSGVPTGRPSNGAEKGEKIEKDKGKGKAIQPASIVEENDPDLDIKMTQVLDILPGYSPDYIRALLLLPAYHFRGNAEKVVEALLEGTAPTPEDVNRAKVDMTSEAPKEEAFVYTKDRRNVFDDEVMDESRVHVGKKALNKPNSLEDRRLLDEMKEDILRRAEAMALDDEDDEDEFDKHQDKGKGKNTARASEEDQDLYDEESVRVVGDGEASGEDHGSEDEDDAHQEGHKAANTAPETILELAYLRNPKLFDRDAQTRRSKERADLKDRTGYADEQIEGWRVMLERNPKKDNLLQKHEFSGNRAGFEDEPSEPSSAANHGQTSRGGMDRGQGRGRGRGRGGGRGGQTGGDGGPGNARERAWKDKNKASRGNHNRKRGHDKKMERAGGPS